MISAGNDPGSGIVNGVRADPSSGVGTGPGGSAVSLGNVRPADPDRMARRGSGLCATASPARISTDRGSVRAVLGWVDGGRVGLDSGRGRVGLRWVVGGSDPDHVGADLEWVVLGMDLDPDRVDPGLGPGRVSRIAKATRVDPGGEARWDPVVPAVPKVRAEETGIGRKWTETFPVSPASA